jgi:hypothetical protein
MAAAQLYSVDLIQEVVEINGFWHLTSDLCASPLRRRALSDFDVCYKESKEVSCNDEMSVDVASTEPDFDSIDADSMRRDLWSSDADSDTQSDAETIAWDSETEDNHAAKAAVPPTVVSEELCRSMIPVQPCMLVQVAAAYQDALPRKSAPDLTSVMVRNIPNNLSRNQLVELLNTQGFHACFDFLYLPIDFAKSANLGYAYINLIDSANAIRFMVAFQGFCAWQESVGKNSKKVLEVQWCASIQGCEEHVARYRDSPLMHDSVPEEYRPLLLRDGVPVPFPAPIKPVRKPRGSTRVGSGKKGNSFQSRAIA